MSDRLSDKCNPHPDAPHGFDRNSSATEDRYVCDCEHWMPPDDLRDRIAAVLIEAAEFRGVYQLHNPDMRFLADAVIRELPELTALRRCGRCRIPCLPHEYPPMSEGSNELRPFCIPCTEYIEWATS